MAIRNQVGGGVSSIGRQNSNANVVLLSSGERIHKAVVLRCSRYVRQRCLR